MESNLMSGSDTSVQDMLAKSRKQGGIAGIFSLKDSVTENRAGFSRKLMIAGGLAGVAVVGYWAFGGFSAAADAPQFSTASVGRGNLEVTVTATGNLQPLNQVDIGTEVSGTVETVSVDYNDHVKKGQELARLITVQWQDQVRKGKASLASAEARLQQAEATVIEASREYQRRKDLHAATEGRLPSQAEMDSAEAADRRARADRAVAAANVESASADLASAETNLAKAIIVSPIDGVVLSRVVEPGQTVAASLSAPTLFTLAEDLSKMELEVSVDEADIGQVSKGLNARFSVDAWPGREYPAYVTRVSLGSSIVDNVVSYSTLLSVANPDESLRPGMTATATITTQSREDALLVPNAALRFTPPVELMPEFFLDMSDGPGGPEGEGPEGVPGDWDPGMGPGMGMPPGAGPGEGPPERSGERGGNRARESGGILSQLMPGPPRFMRGPRNRNRGNDDTGSNLPMKGPRRLWVLEDGILKPVRVRTGISDSRYTEIVDGDLREGMRVVTGLSGARG
ncbi:efflux RND transporter periplasmic adaptor subunit [Microbulbifer bruguierae]|uniref:Efflux RND transporter periplasmic adaptor subunit n=1 Tax=Microbulbifer bruguierae TaxID=3029061 RepID=A0ABY8NJI7_9GAMM|nr:efflux RND transporter periplasmic adaptor subunit [Microbulbifer bruguierae]WGL17763.1 efflux RND transporter periplasmic adaptor subunit [Microbulbifer bruguierae]